MEFKLIFAKEIKENKKTRHLNQQELGELFGVSRVTINTWLSGKAKPSLEKIEKIAKVLEIPVSELLGKENYNDLSDLDEELIKLTKEQKIFTLEFFRLMNKKPELKDSLLKLLNLYLETTE
jgi:transcriptional regulator with XRE-family HTH domain